MRTTATSWKTFSLSHTTVAERMFVMANVELQYQKKKGEECAVRKAYAHFF